MPRVWPFRQNVAPLVAVVIFLGPMLTGCRSQPSERAAQTQGPAQTTAPQATTPQRFDVRGKVVAVDKAGKKVTVDGEAIPGFMSAMTMAYPVKDEHALDNVAPGEQVTAKLVSTGSEYWLEDIAPAKPSESDK